MSKSRSASLRVAHQRDCPNATRTSLESLEGCRCKPAYYTMHRDRTGKPVKGPRVGNRQVAERALRKLLVELDEGRVGIATQGRRVRRTFSQWADEYLENLERDKGDKGSTIRAYHSTLSFTRPIIGSLDLDEIGQPELRLIVRAIREPKIADVGEGEWKRHGGSDATVHKHLRHLRAILTAAVDEGYAPTNPLTTKFIKDLRLRVPNRVESYTDDELAKLLAQMQALRYAPVYITVIKAALATGARIGELVALDWNDVALGAGELHIRRHWDALDGPSAPKGGSERVVYLLRKPKVPDLIDGVAVLEQWTAFSGVMPGDSPVFPAPRGGRLNSQYLRKLVDQASDKAGIAELGEGGRRRKPLHALRGSHARIAREAGFPTWLIQANLGHSTPLLTENTYGTIGIDALRTAARGDAASQPS
jgi:integrase